MWMHNHTFLLRFLVCTLIVMVLKLFARLFMHELKKVFLKLIHLYFIFFLAVSIIPMLNTFEQKGIDDFGTKDPKKNYK